MPTVVPEFDYCDSILVCYCFNFNTRTFYILETSIGFLSLKKKRKKLLVSLLIDQGVKVYTEKYVKYTLYDVSEP